MYVAAKRRAGSKVPAEAWPLGLRQIRILAKVLCVTANAAVADRFTLRYWHTTSCLDDAHLEVQHACAGVTAHARNVAVLDGASLG